MAKKIVKIKVDVDNDKSLKRAEREKKRLENEGYNLIDTDAGFNKMVMTYSKEE